MEVALNEVIETPRCRLSPARAAHLGLFVRLHSNPSVRRFLGGAIDPISAAQRFELLRAGAAVTALAATLTSNTEDIGIVTFGPHHDGSDVELSYQLLPQYWGQGLATEIVAAALDAMFAWHPTLGQIVAETQAANSRSRKLLRRVGMSHVRPVRRFGQDQIIYALRRPT